MTQQTFRLTVVLSGGQQTGGGFHQAITNVRMLLRELPQSIELSILDVRGTFRDALAQMEQDGLLSHHQLLAMPARMSGFRDRVITDDRLLYRIARWLLLQTGKNVRMSKVARYLDLSDCDLVYFVSPNSVAHELQLKPYIWTLWDLAHIDSPEFPEVRTSGKFEGRENFHHLALRKAASVVVDSGELAQKAQRYFGVPEEKFIVIPFEAPNSRTSLQMKPTQLPADIQDASGKYFFYPAQLWTHKNHLRIVEAISLLVSQGKDVHAVFAGKDHGFGEKIKERIRDFGLDTRVHLLGYVEDEAIPALYRESLGLVMASYFGPTNIPPLEAMVFEVPVIASNVHRGQLGDAALYFDPDDSEELAAQMHKLLNPTMRTKLAKVGIKQLGTIDQRRAEGIRQLVEVVSRIKRRLVG